MRSYHGEDHGATGDGSPVTTSQSFSSEFGNNVNPDEVAYDEPPHLDLHCLPFNL